MKGKVYLVGAGPGDPELLTLKALRVLQTADAVLHDDLVAPEILRWIPATAEIHDVGKRCGKKKISQTEINDLMIALAEAGMKVVRLKGGDPLIFGRAGEEMESLRAADIPFDIVPGVTSALGAAAAAQIPLTHRRTSSSLVLVTAHRASEKDSTDKAASEKDALQWNRLVTSGATLVIYMPGQNYAEIANRLTTAGLSSDTPCAVISRATTSHQRTHLTTVRDLQSTPLLASPTLLVVGEVVGLADPVAASEFAFPCLSPTEALLPATLLPLFEFWPRARTNEEPRA
ncbi:MAG: uroporphyrinogen-III C-methyltransferase [Terriglobales bacterium]